MFWDKLQWPFGNGKKEEVFVDPILPVPIEFVFDKPSPISLPGGATDVSADGISFIKKEEGFEKNAYQDSVGVWTIGHGTIRIHGRLVKKGDVCTEAQAEEWLLHEIKHECVPYINRLVTVPLTQEMFDMLCSFIYNLGWPSFQKSTLLKELNAGNYLGAADQILRWNKGKVNGVFVVIDGLDKRRRREREIFANSIVNVNANIG